MTSFTPTGTDRETLGRQLLRRYRVLGAHTSLASLPNREAAAAIACFEFQPRSYGIDAVVVIPIDADVVALVPADRLGQLQAEAPTFCRAVGLAQALANGAGSVVPAQPRAPRP